MPMQCSECGFTLSSQGKPCPTCNRLRVQSSGSLQDADSLRAAQILEAIQPPNLPTYAAVQTQASTSAFKQCPECNFACGASVQQCPQCGHKFRTQFAAPVAPKPIHKTTAIGCPKCGSQDIQKVSMLVHTGDEDEPPPPGFNLALAKRLSPPVMPEYTVPQAVYAVGLAGLMFLLGVIAYLVAPTAQGFLGPITLLLLGATVVTGVIAMQNVNQAKLQFERKEQKYHQAMEQWNMLFYCPNCDSIYHLGTHQYAPSNAMHTLLSAIPA